MKTQRVVPLVLLALLVLVLLYAHASYQPALAQGPQATRTPTPNSAAGLSNVRALHLPSDSFVAFFPFIGIQPPPPPPPFSEMIEVPAGTFQMGCDSTVDTTIGCSGSAYNGYVMELPLHTVYLDNYLIDKYSVTNGRYALCVAMGRCGAPETIGSNARLNSPAYSSYPVVDINWYNAQAFCMFEGKRLPSEAEWEKAARGSSDTRIFPWGNTYPGQDCSYANVREFNGMCVGDATPVDAYFPINTSPYGLRGMSGNVWNWVNDWYQEDYYSFSPYSDPTGPATQQTAPSCDYCKVARGGSWYFMQTYARTSYRGRFGPFQAADWLGLRCAV